ncbi:MAG: lipopolysaccharide/colanic/teichoic acid biosynthesis glycosyltransferase [Lentimonas sp.]
MEQPLEQKQPVTCKPNLTMNYNTGFQLGYPQERFNTAVSQTSTRRYQLWQGSMRLAAGIALLAMLPIFACIWVAQKCNDRGPFFFKQSRRGFQGKRFEIYKIRTMRVGSEKATALGTQLSNRQVTSLGRILRKLKIDEAPQLFNILRGDMAIVGPRPIPLALDEELSAHLHGFDSRYSTMPGLTSLGQICIDDNALGDGMLHDWKLRFEGELHYIRNQSISYDLLIISMTSCYIIKKLLNR